MEKGEDYRGYKSIAVDRSTCLDWTITTTYHYYYNPMDYPDDGLGAHNYCRYPGGIGDRPWCYYDTWEKDWGYCDIDGQSSSCQTGM